MCTSCRESPLSSGRPDQTVWHDVPGGAPWLERRWGSLTLVPWLPQALEGGESVSGTQDGARMSVGSSGESSVALFSDDGALLDWNSEFAVEFAQASAMVARGADYLTLVAAGLGAAALGVTRDGLGDPRRYRYVVDGVEVAVRESRTAGGALLRLAAPVRAQTRLADELRNLRKALRGREGLAPQGSPGPEVQPSGAAVTSPSRFAATVSHKLRTPMQGVLGRMSLINDIIEVSEMGQGAALRIADLDLVDLVEGVVGLFAVRARDRGLELRIAIDPAVPRVIRGDGLRLRQVLLNILSNAIKFTSRGSIEARVGVDMSGRAFDGPSLRLEIEDSGAGIDPAAVEGIFHRSDGEGVGLTRSRALVERMGGKIGVTSEPGVGSTFWVELPLPQEEVSSVPAPPLASRALAGALDLQGLQLLLVEDNEVNLAVIEAFVVSAGGTCDVATSGTAAIKACARGSYDVVLMDIHMQGMDGLTASQIIRAARDPEGPPIKIIAITADARPEVQVQAADVGMDGWIAKPFHRDQLVLAIQEALGRGPG